jgi:hypothetical protein
MGRLRVPYHQAVSHMREPGVLLVLQPPNFIFRSHQALRIPGGWQSIAGQRGGKTVQRGACARQFPWSRRLDPVDSAQGDVRPVGACGRLAGRATARRATVEATAHLTKGRPRCGRSFRRWECCFRAGVNLRHTLIQLA